MTSFLSPGTLQTPASLEPNATPGLTYRIVRWFLTILFVVAMFATAVSLLLLFFTTAVPPSLTLAFLLMFITVVAFVLRMKPTALVIVLGNVGMILITVVAVASSQGFASTPMLLDNYGNPLCNCIASLESITLGGSEQWITIRGRDSSSPVLLYLAGGPGGSELVMTRRYLGELEEHFVVVNWDQPGAGKSYGAVDISTLTPERYISDAHELVQYLRTRFDKEKIYLVGESWGTILGIWLVQQYPDMFHAYVGAGQMVNTTENDVLGYEFAIDYLVQQGRVEQAEALRQMGAPPYVGSDMALRYMDYMGVLNDYMRQHAYGEGISHSLFTDSLLAPEYGLIDKVNWVRGLKDVFTHVYPQIEDLEFRTQATHLEVPVYFIEGRWDVNAMTSLVESYYAILDAPHKEIIWFEDAAHPGLWDEPAHFADVMVNTVLRQTQSEQASE